MSKKEEETNEVMDKVEKKLISNYQRKKKEAEVHNMTMDIANNLLFIGHCGTCAEKAPLAMYLKSNEENICNYYCLGCGKVATIKNIDKKDSFLFPMIDIVHVVAKNYDPDVFDRVYNG